MNCMFVKQTEEFSKRGNNRLKINHERVIFTSKNGEFPEQKFLNGA